MLLTRELRQELEKIFQKEEDFKNMFITVMSFGFKYGIPEDADLVFDVRFLPNPYYAEELRPLTGEDSSVRDYVMQGNTAELFLCKLKDMIDFLLPNYINEGKNQLVIAIGCTGGKTPFCHCGKGTLCAFKEPWRVWDPHGSPGY